MEVLDIKGNRKIKRENPINIDPEGSEEEEGEMGRRRSGRLAKSQARFKQKAKRFRVEEEEEDVSGDNERGTEEELSGSKAGRASVEKESTEISDGSAWRSLDNSTATTHVSANFSLQMVKLCGDKSRLEHYFLPC